jgi:hypothetical protein
LSSIQSIGGSCAGCCSQFTIAGSERARRLKSRIRARLAFKIVRIIGESPFGIHDISHVEADPKTQLPRFNMPLELGLFLGAKAYGDSANQGKRCIVFDKQPFRYQRFCSDLSGQDIRAHAGRVSLSIELVRNWLATTEPAKGAVIPSGSVIAGRYKAFRAAQPAGCVRLQLNPKRLTFADDVTLVVGWLQENPWSAV